MLFALCGCVHYEPQRIDPEQNLRLLAARSLNDQGLRAFIAGEMGGSPDEIGGPWDLETLTLTAIYFRPELAEARAALRAAEGALTVAGERPNPSLVASADYNSTISIPSPWIIKANIVSYLGAIIGVGIVAKNGILMLDYVEVLRAEGMAIDEALVRSGHRRLRPVLMTSLAAGLGMLPLAYGVGAGADMLKPLAIAVIGALTISVALSLIATPVVVSLLMSDKVRADSGQPQRGYGSSSAALCPRLNSASVAISGAGVVALLSTRPGRTTRSIRQ